MGNMMGGAFSLALEQRIKEIESKLNNLFAVGQVHISFSDTNPSELFGGTWERIRGKFLLAESDDYTIGTTGGEATHTLTVREMPSHNHESLYAEFTSGGHSRITATTNTNDMSTYSKYTGGSQPHNNMPPYIAVYMWRRIA